MYGMSDSAGLAFVAGSCIAGLLRKARWCNKEGKLCYTTVLLFTFCSEAAALVSTRCMQASRILTSEALAEVHFSPL